MMTKEEDFDCVKFVREARDRMAEEWAGMTFEEVLAWWRNLDFSDDPILHDIHQRGVRQRERRARERREHSSENGARGLEPARRPGDHLNRRSPARP